MANTFANNQDSEVKVLPISTADLVSVDKAGLITYLNTVAGFVKTGIEQIVFHVTTPLNTVPERDIKFILVNKRKNRYGLGGVLLAEEDVLLMEDNIVELTSSDNSIKIENNDLIVNTEGWSLDSDLDSLTSDIIL